MLRPEPYHIGDITLSAIVHDAFELHSERSSTSRMFRPADVTVMGGVAVESERLEEELSGGLAGYTGIEPVIDDMILITILYKINLNPVACKISMVHLDIVKTFCARGTAILSYIAIAFSKYSALRREGARSHPSIIARFAPFPAKGLTAWFASPIQMIGPFVKRIWANGGRSLALNSMTVVGSVAMTSSLTTEQNCPQALWTHH